jgi:hypothetical protein
VGGADRGGVVVVVGGEGDRAVVVAGGDVVGVVAQQLGDPCPVATQHAQPAPPAPAGVAERAGGGRISEHALTGDAQGEGGEAAQWPEQLLGQALLLQHVFAQSRMIAG